MMAVFIEVFGTFGLTVSESKTETMCMSNPHARRSTIGRGADVTIFSPFRKEMLRKQPLPGTYLTSPLVKLVEFEASLPTMERIM